mmetsp:Transcript_31576/g.72276  ORF Transcript_31576/g.72276 Transcript_31576/m.72276 type:complete len:174 (+) Transcript_31576:43-564(+)
MAGFSLESCGKRRHEAPPPDDASAMQERIKRLRIANGGDANQLLPRLPESNALQTPHPGLARAWALSQPRAGADQDQQQFSAHGANSFSSVPPSLHLPHQQPQQQQQIQMQQQLQNLQQQARDAQQQEHMHQYLLQQDHNYAAMNAMLRQLHVERVLAGMRKPWIEEEDEQLL